ncbi:VPLPA-CTERM sorting domain-containing protein [Hyphococcus luteus]|uniref:PEP-CTERM sorting domain-containing protein n=1 Tax=Hyphococcus luteus TaxID=2058213 RepID=A0A2S7K804_9PROT|nr:VPLPA-CTERM sorting domain-containing protein [Marinicaulis flavus]PQA88623.1 PEP-CTERM sorting domain-containing protein [Marinicaulis flavus]
MKLKTFAVGLVAAVFSHGAAQAAPVSFTKLTGVTGDPGAAQTAVFKADLSTAGLASFSALSISDSGVIGGSSPGEFSGFDLDAVIISATNCASAACVAALTSDVVFNYAASIFTPGTQLAPTDPKLYGTDGTGSNVDNATATLGSFDGYSSTITPDGFLSLGVNGSIGFNFMSAIAAASPLYLYIGEVGDNGELAEGGIQIFEDPISEVPLPAALPLFLMGAGALGFHGRRKRKTA